MSLNQPLVPRPSSNQFDVRGMMRKFADAIRELQDKLTTLSGLNEVVGETLDTSSDSRTPKEHALGGDNHSASTLSALNALVSNATLADVDSGTWSPEVYVQSTKQTGYTDQEGWYLRVGDTVLITGYVRITISASSESVSIRNHPFTRDATVLYWPVWISQCSLVNGDVHGRLASDDKLFINDAGDDLGVAAWTFTDHDFYCNFGAVYRRT